MRNRRQRSEKGTQMVEMAILLPLLIWMVLGAADFARVSYTAITLAHAARAGAQYGIQSNGTAADHDGIEQAARDEAQNLDAIDVTAEHFCRCPSAAAEVSCTVNPCGGNAPKELYVRVTTGATFTTIAPYPGVPSSVAMTRRAVLRVR